MDFNNKEEVKKAIESGTPCYYRYGFKYRGAESKRISVEKALELLPKYSPGMGFWELCGETIDGQEVIMFNEYSANDLF